MENITKQSTIKYLNKMLLKRINEETFLNKKTTDTYFADDRNKLLVYLGHDLCFFIDWSVNGESAIICEGYELITDRADVLNKMKQFIDCKLTETEILNYIK